MVVPASNYNPLIPQPTDIIANSQGQILNNFGAIQTLVDADHVDFAAVGAGFHNQSTYPIQAGAPAATGGAVRFFSLTSALTSQPELQYQRQSGSTAPAAVQQTEFTSAGWASPGWAVLPSGILLKWGTGSGNGSVTVTFPVAGTIPVYNAILIAFLTPTSNISAYVSAQTTTTLTVVTSALGSFNYLAIGY